MPLFEARVRLPFRAETVEAGRPAAPVSALAHAAGFDLVAAEVMPVADENDEEGGWTSCRPSVPSRE